MNVLVLCHELPPVGGGAGSACAALAQEYAVAGCRVTVVTMGWRDLPPEERSAGGVEVVRLPCGRRRHDQASAIEALRWARRAGAWARRRHARDPFDVVHAHFVMPAGLVAAGLQRSRRARLPFVLTAHGTDVPGYNRHRFRSTHRLVRPLWRWVCRAARPLVSPSESLRGLIRAAVAGAEPLVLPNPVDTRRFAPGAKQRRILLCGRLVARKGFADLLAALAGVELPGWEIQVVGDGPERRALERLAAGLAVPVRFAGWIGQDDPRLPEVFARAAVFVLPSSWENLSVALLEAMAAGCAVIASDVPGNREAVGEAALFVAPGDGPGLARAVRRLAADAEARGALGAAARRRAEAEFASRSVAARYLERLAAAARGGAP